MPESGNKSMTRAVFLVKGKRPNAPEGEIGKW
jgi:hypothetical protein